MKVDLEGTVETAIKRSKECYSEFKTKKPRFTVWNKEFKRVQDAHNEVRALVSPTLPDHLLIEIIVYMVEFNLFLQSTEVQLKEFESQNERRKERLLELEAINEQRRKKIVELEAIVERRKIKEDLERTIQQRKSELTELERIFQQRKSQIAELFT